MEACLDRLVKDRHIIPGINLDAAPVVVQNANPSLGINFHRAGMAKALFVARVNSIREIPLKDHVRVGGQLVPTPLGKGPITDEMGDISPVRSEHLDSVVPPVRYEDVPVVVDGDSVGAVKLTDV